MSDEGVVTVETDGGTWSATEREVRAALRGLVVPLGAGQSNANTVLSAAIDELVRLRPLRAAALRYGRLAAAREQLHQDWLLLRGDPDETWARLRASAPEAQAALDELLALALALATAEGQG